MFTADATQLVDTILSHRTMSAEDLLALRRAFGADLTLSPDEADSLFAINALDDLPDGWASYFVTVMSCFVVDDMPPVDYLHEANAAWLMARIDHDGVVETETELALVLAVLRQAHSVPDRFAAYALTQVREAVLNGRGVYGRKVLTPGVIGEAEVEMLRTVLYAGGGTQGLSVSRGEAEALMDLNDATDGRDNAPGWTFLFSRALANHLMMVATPDAPCPVEALRREAWLNSDEGLKMPTIKEVVGAWSDFFTGRKAEKPVSYVLDAAATAEAERVTLIEADWLIERLNRDGRINANERALLDFLLAECPDVHDALRPLLRAA